MVGFEALAFVLFHHELGVEHIEKLLGEASDAVVDREHHDECGRGDTQPHEGYPRDDVYDALPLAGEEVTAGYEMGQAQGGGGL